MNEKTEAARRTGLEEAPAAFHSPETIEQPERPSWRPEELRGQDLRGQDLTAIEELLPEHLAGADLTGARVPADTANFPALGQVAAISSEARKVFIGLLAACVYSWLVIGTTTDAALILNTASSPLPIINTPIPIAGFYVVGAAILAAVYCYLHFYLQRLWRTLATLPAIFPDGTPLDDRTDPWLLTNLVRADFQRLRRNAPPLTRSENLLTVLLAWWLVPLTLFALWARYLPGHYWLGTTWLVALIGITALFGRHSYRLAGATLRGETPAAAAEDDDSRGVPGRAWHEFRQIRPDWLTVSLTAGVALCSLSAFRDDPSDDHTWLAKLLNLVGIRTYADLREVEVSQRPEGWDGENWSKVKRVDLRGSNLAFVHAEAAFLANADLRGANLKGADLRYAELQGADLQYAELQGADFGGETFLLRSHLQGANLSNARLHGADLSQSQLQGAELRHTEFQGADLSYAQLQGAHLDGARLQGANLVGAELEGAVMFDAQLQGADLRYARLRGVELLGAGLWRASVEGAEWYLADLRSTDVQPMVNADVDALLSDLTNGVSGEKGNQAVTRVTGALRTADRSAKPDFPEEWRFEPDVMFNPENPSPESFPWGPSTWLSEEHYDQNLASFLGEIACGQNVHEAQTRGLAWRAILSVVEDPGRVWPALFASRLIGTECPPAERLPEDTRRRLQELAVAAAETFSRPWRW